MIHVIKTQDLTVSYDNQVVALEGVNLELADPTITGIIGPNHLRKSKSKYICCFFIAQFSK